ncbi:TPA: YfjI family protein [Pseudomonas aeruginosa]|nr:DUF3987 domain-containing protein [Pseudomonas aeruginosa]
MNIPIQFPRIGAPFPMIASLPRISSIVDELQSNIQAPRPLIFSSVLSAISLALQGLVDVQKPKGGVSPCSLMLLSIADSGERKSSIDKVVHRRYREAQAKAMVEYEKELAVWVVERDIWNMKRRAIQKGIEKRAAREEDSSELERQYSELSVRGPRKIKKFQMLYEDTTTEAFFDGLYKYTPTAGIITSEGGGVLKGSALNDFSKMNSLWSGDPINVSRLSRESFILEDARLTVSVMVQGDVFDKYLLKSGDQARCSGLWARFLVCRPDSTQGQRFIRVTDSDSGCGEAFFSRLDELIAENILRSKEQVWSRQVLSFDDGARERWVQIFNFIEENMADGRFWGGMKDHASKLADNIARLAALFHCFESGGGSRSISERTLDAAIFVGFWYSAEFAKIFSEAGQVEGDAIELLKWLERKGAGEGVPIRKNLILQYGPARLRNKAKLEAVLLYLCERCSICFDYIGRVTYVRFVAPLGGPYSRNHNRRY